MSIILPKKTPKLWDLYSESDHLETELFHLHYILLMSVSLWNGKHPNIWIAYIVGGVHQHSYNAVLTIMPMSSLLPVLLAGTCCHPHGPPPQMATKPFAWMDTCVNISHIGQRVRDMPQEMITPRGTISLTPLIMKLVCLRRKIWVILPSLAFCIHSSVMYYIYSEYNCLVVKGRLCPSSPFIWLYNIIGSRSVSIQSFFFQSDESFYSGIIYYRVA
jgi:hypothetical protein